MGEGDIGRLFDRIEQMRAENYTRSEKAKAENENRHREVMVALTKLESRQDHQEEGMAKYQESISTLHECVGTIKLERAGEKGKLAGILFAATILGNIIMAILSRAGVLDTIFGG